VASQIFSSAVLACGGARRGAYRGG